MAISELGTCAFVLKTTFLAENTASAQLCAEGICIGFGLSPEGLEWTWKNFQFPTRERMPGRILLASREIKALKIAKLRYGECKSLVPMFRLTNLIYDKSSSGRGSKQDRARAVIIDSSKQQSFEKIIWVLGTVRCRGMNNRMCYSIISLCCWYSS